MKTCEKCGNLAVTGSTRCETCIFKQKAKTHLGSSERWLILKEIWDRQESRCIYTGIMLNLVDADVDHIIPGKNNDPSNLQFVLRAVNEMKKDHSEVYFLDLVKKVFCHCLSTGKLTNPLE